MKNQGVRAPAGSVLLALVGLAAVAPAAPAALATAPVSSSSATGTARFEAVVEAVRQTVVSAQVAGRVTEIRVKVGDTVHAGNVLARLDAGVAERTAASGDAQVQAARATLEAASQDLERKRQLLKKNYISQAAFERAQEQFRASEAQLDSQVAQAAAAHTQSALYVVEAPYSGVVSEVPVALGDMAMPGKPLVTIYDPSDLRVTAWVPQTAVTAASAAEGLRVEIPGLPLDRQIVVPTRVLALPTVDPVTHTLEMRMDLPHRLSGVVPGMFARAALPAQPDASNPSAAGATGAASARLFVPIKAIVRRAEVTAVYVVDEDGRPILRQVRLGELHDDSVEVLSGVRAGENVALDPQAAARPR